MVNLELYRVFYTVAKCGSLTKAASELYISQPAVSQAVKQLETQLGTSLFNRTHRGMELTAGAGKVIFCEVEKALSLLDGVENTMDELNSTATGTLRIGASDTIFAHVLADKIARFNFKYPSVKLELLSANSPETITQLKDGRCDVAFLNLPVEENDVQFLGTVYSLTDVFIAGKGYESLKEKVVPLEKLSEYPLLMIESNTVSRRALSDYTKGLGFCFTPDIEVSGWDLMLKLVSRGMGIGCIPREYCKKEIESKEVFEIATAPRLPVRGVGMALAKHVQPSYALKQFITLFDWLK